MPLKHTGGMVHIFLGLLTHQDGSVKVTAGRLYLPYAKRSQVPLSTVPSTGIQPKTSTIEDDWANEFAFEAQPHEAI